MEDEEETTSQRLVAHGRLVIHRQPGEPFVQTVPCTRACRLHVPTPATKNKML